jgi:phage terminase large subunit-like protein
VSELAEVDRFFDELVHAYGDDAIEALEDLLSRLSVVELAGLWADWRFWARPKQIPPSQSFRSWGFLTGRGFGKTLTCSRHINEEVNAGRAPLILLIAQDEQSSIDIQVNGPSGLIATGTPGNVPEWVASSLMVAWPNGARAYVRTPEVPGKIRGLEYHLAWCTEIQSWPEATRAEAWSNVLLSVRLGYARTIWDCTPKRGHPILKELLERAREEPGKHVVVRGSTYENASNLGDGYVEDLERKYKDTSAGREELGGEMLDDAEGATTAQSVIDETRRAAPDKWRRRIVAIDPATTARAGSDDTGIMLLGLGTDAECYVLQDLTGKHKAEVWAALTIDTYLAHRCDSVVVETNKGGDLLAQNLRAEATPRGITVMVLPKKAAVVPHNPRIIYVREVYGRGSKLDRARPVGTAYERKRVHHVIDAKLGELEEILTGWVPSPTAKSPGRLDSLVHGVVELLGLSEGAEDHSAGFDGIMQASNALRDSVKAPTLALPAGLANFLGPSSRRSGRI